MDLPETRAAYLHIDIFSNFTKGINFYPLYDQYREELFTKARNCIKEWDNLSNCDKLSTLFTELPRSLGKYVKHSFISRRRTIFK